MDVKPFVHTCCVFTYNPAKLCPSSPKRKHGFWKRDDFHGTCSEMWSNFASISAKGWLSDDSSILGWQKFLNRFNVHTVSLPAVLGIFLISCVFACKKRMSSTSASSLTWLSRHVTWIHRLYLLGFYKFVRKLMQVASSLVYLVEWLRNAAS